MNKKPKPEKELKRKLQSRKAKGVESVQNGKNLKKNVKTGKQSLALETRRVSGKETLNHTDKTSMENYPYFQQPQYFQK